MSTAYRRKTIRALNLSFSFLPLVPIWYLENEFAAPDGCIANKTARAQINKQLHELDVPAMGFKQASLDAPLDE